MEWSVYGDTNSTLSGALVASKLNTSFHIEAGLRSYNREMPEEINRVLTDHFQDAYLLLLISSKNLKKKVLLNGVYNVGDIMKDLIRYVQKKTINQKN